MAAIASVIDDPNRIGDGRSIGYFLDSMACEVEGGVTADWTMGGDDNDEEAGTLISVLSVVDSVAFPSFSESKLVRGRPLLFVKVAVGRWHTSARRSERTSALGAKATASVEINSRIKTFNMVFSR